MPTRAVFASLAHSSRNSQGSRPRRGQLRGSLPTHPHHQPPPLPRSSPPPQRPLRQQPAAAHACGGGGGGGAASGARASERARTFRAERIRIQTNASSPRAPPDGLTGESNLAARVACLGRSTSSPSHARPDTDSLVGRSGSERPAGPFDGSMDPSIDRSWRPFVSSIHALTPSFPGFAPRSSVGRRVSTLSAGSLCQVLLSARRRTPGPLRARVRRRGEGERGGRSLRRRGRAGG